MAHIRYVEVRRFRGVAHANWAPEPGINALIGPGDAGKSTLLDAIDLVLQPRRMASFSDADFYGLDPEQPIVITVTLGDLPKSLLDLDSYSLFLRGWCSELGIVTDEPVAGSEAVLSIRLTVTEELEPRWSLYSDRAEAEGLTRDLPWAERLALAPVRLGAFASHHLSWSPRSVLNRVSEERASASQALADAARQARNAFGDTAGEQVPETLALVSRAAKTVGVRGAEAPRALLDANGVSFTGGAIALHDARGVPLRNLGVGSSRLLVAGLQSLAGDQAAVTLVDELEHGLEPFRISRLLQALGSKAKTPGPQVFLTTHSSVAVRELAASQLWRVLPDDGGSVTIRGLGVSEESQKTVRANAEAFLAPSVLVCEGPTEIGLARGLDLYWTEQGQGALAYLGVALCDGGGSNMFSRAACFGRMGYRTALWRDSDVGPTTDQQESLDRWGVKQFAWAPSLSTEQQLFASLTPEAVGALIDLAIEYNGADSVTAHVRAQDAAIDLASVSFGLTPDQRAALGRAAGKGKWFKWVEPAERIGREILGPHLATAQAPLPNILGALRLWMVGPPPPPPPPTPDPEVDDLEI